MTRSEAQAFLDLPDHSRTAVLKTLTPLERAEALAAIVVALSRSAEIEVAA